MCIFKLTVVIVMKRCEAQVLYI